MSEKVKNGDVCGEAVAEGTMAPSGTWWTTLGPKVRWLLKVFIRKELTNYLPAYQICYKISL
jgi:hypothetical protein